jgi:hypothetical protein
MDSEFRERQAVFDQRIAAVLGVLGTFAIQFVKRIYRRPAISRIAARISPNCRSESLF